MVLLGVAPTLARPRLSQISPAMMSAACLRGPELPSLPPCPPSFTDKERERREKGGGELDEGQLREAAAEKWREALQAAVMDLKAAQVGWLVVVMVMVWCVGNVG